MPSRPPFLAFVKDAADLATLRAYAEKNQWGAASIYEGDITTATDLLRQHPSPDCLMVEIASAEQAPAQLDALAEVCAPDVKVIVTGKINEFSFYTWLTEIGVASYLLQPLSEANLQSAFNKLQQQAAAAAPSAQREKAPARMLAVMGTRGGVGATSFGICLAKYIAEIGGRSVVLLDLDPQDGSVALMLDLEPSRGLREALEKPGRIDALFIDRVILRVNDKLAVMSAEESLAERMAYHETAAISLLNELRTKFDVIIMDLPRRLSYLTRQSLQHTEDLVLVTEMTLAGLRDGMRLHEAFRDGFKLKKPPLVVGNRIGLAPKYEMSVTDYEKGAGFKVSHQIPFSPDMFMAISGEFSLSTYSNTPAYEAIAKVAEALMPGITPEQEKKKPGLLDRFKKG